jgi:pSer/pThr/pTyr-binding forkhead associated (FHA) protein
MGARGIALDRRRPFVIGRGNDCSLKIEDRHLSLRHAELTVREDGVWIEDLKSRNGVFVNEKRIEGPRRLDQGDRITIGKHDFTLSETAIEQLAPEGRTRGRASVFELLFDVCDKAFAAGSTAEAESAVTYLVHGLTEAIARGKAAEANDVDRAVGHLIVLTETTRSSAWLVKLLELHQAAQRVPEDPTIDRLVPIIGKVRPSPAARLRAYCEAAAARKLGPDAARRLDRMRNLAD